MYLRDSCNTLFLFIYIKGHDTTTTAIHFCLYNIAKYPLVQEKCFREIVDVIGMDGKKPAEYAELCNLQYLEKVIKETLRMFPPVPIIGRSLREEVTISKSGTECI